jgi:hypothetical protein
MRPFASSMSSLFVFLTLLLHCMDDIKRVAYQREIEQSVFRPTPLRTKFPEIILNVRRDVRWKLITFNLESSQIDDALRLRLLRERAQELTYGLFPTLVPVENDSCSHPHYNS